MESSDELREVQQSVDLSSDAGQDARPSESSRASIGSMKTGWYVGKYLGFRKHKAADNERDERLADAEMEAAALAAQDSASASGDQPAQQTTAESSAGSSRSWFSFASRKPTEAEKEAEAQESEKEERKNERALVSMVRKIRAKLIERKLDGTIFVRRVFGVVSAALTCHVKASSGGLGRDSFDEEEEELPFQCRRAVTSTDLILDSLERRSRGWNGVDFAEDMVLTRGLTLGVSDPFLGIIGWSLQVDISATVTSLLASRKRYDLLRASSVSDSSFRFSFSFSSNKPPDLSLPALTPAGATADRDSSGSEDARDADGDPTK